MPDRSVHARWVDRAEVDQRAQDVGARNPELPLRSQTHPIGRPVNDDTVEPEIASFGGEDDVDRVIVRAGNPPEASGGAMRGEGRLADGVHTGDDPLFGRVGRSDESRDPGMDLDAACLVRSRGTSSHASGRTLRR